MSQSWPISSDYAAAVQTPDVCCSDPDLRSARAATSALGLPRSCGGTFGDVYQFQSSDKKGQWAVKCFTKSVAKLNERYDQISLELARSRLPFAVEFNYLPHGILVRGEWYPLLKMEWVDGLTLRQFVIQNLNKPKLLAVLLEIWLKVLPRLREAGIAHGDLQHGNVMLIPGSTEGSLALRLIDYDGMWVPSMSGQPPTELGHPNYQHPQRAKQNIFSPEIDRFPHLVIACALRCLTRPGGERLWKDYDNQDNLLFTKQDFEAPTKSKLLHELWGSGDRELQSWAGHLVTASQTPLEATSLLSTLVNDGRIRPLSDAEEKSIRSILGPAAPVAETDLKSGEEADWWGAELAESLTEEPDDELIEEVERRTVVRPDKKVANRTKSSGRRTKQKAKVESDTERTVPHWVWTSVGTLAVCILIGLYFGTRRHDAATEAGSSAAAVASPDSTSGTKPDETSKPEPDPDWNPANVRELATLSGHNDEVVAMVFSPDGKWLASAGGATVKVWDTVGGKVSLTLGHAHKVRSLAFSPDGTRLASASFDRTVKVWDTTSGQEALTFNHTSSVLSVAFSPDGKRLASGEIEHKVTVWDATDGDVLLTLNHYPYSVWSVAFSPDGNRLASADSSGTLKVWNSTSGQETLMLKGQGYPPQRAAFSADGTRLVSDGRICSSTSGEVLSGTLGFSQVFSPDWKRKASSGSDQAVLVVDVANEKLLLTLKGHTSDVTSMAFSADGKRLASAEKYGTVKIWGAERSGTDLSIPADVPIKLPDLIADRLKQQQVEINFSRTPLDDAFKLIADGCKVTIDIDSDALKASGFTKTMPQTLKLGKVTGLEAIAGILKRYENEPVPLVLIIDELKKVALITTKEFAEKDRLVITDLESGSIPSGSPYSKPTVVSKPAPDPDWDPANVRELATLTGHTGVVWSVAFSADGKRLASLGIGKDDEPGEVKVWYATSGQERLTLKVSVARGGSVAFSPDGKRVASSGGYDNAVKVWDATSGQETLTLKGHNGSVTSVAFSPDGKQVASSGGYDKTIKVWDANSGQQLLTLTGHTDYVTSVVFSPDGNRLASASWDKTVKVWDATIGQETLTLKGHNGSVTSVAFSPDGKRLASGSADQRVKVWDAASGQKTLTVQGHTSAVTSVAFSPDGKQVASSGYDKTVKVWDATSGQETLTLKGHTSVVMNMAFSPDGKRLASADGYTVKIWGSGEALRPIATRSYLQSPSSALGTPEYAVEIIVLHLSAGAPSGLEDFISPNCVGLLANVRDGNATNSQMTDLEKLFNGLQAVGRPRTEDGAKIFSLRNSEGDTITFKVKLKGGTYKVIEMTVKPASSKKK